MDEGKLKGVELYVLSVNIFMLHSKLLTRSKYYNLLRYFKCALLHSYSTLQ